MIKFANPSAQYQAYQSEIDQALKDVLNSDTYILGKQVSLLEEEFAEYIGSNFSIGVANGTDALELALRALDIGNGDEVITVSHTAVATVAAVEAAGALPVLADIEEDTYTIDISKISELLTKKTKALIAVHLYGGASNIDDLLTFCKSNKLKFIEDVSQAHGAKWKNKRLGSFGDISCFSCFPTKNLGAIGDAGLITTNDEALSLKLKMLREYGWKNRISQLAGRNSRLDEIQAAILRVKLAHLDDTNNKRIELANIYNSELGDLPLILPASNQSASHVFHLYVVRLDKRDELLDYLRKKEIFAGIHYPSPVHLQPIYKNKLHYLDLSITESISGQIISLPLYPELTDVQQLRVIEALKSFCY